jgi:hypothetical protein
MRNASRSDTTVDSHRLLEPARYDLLSAQPTVISDSDEPTNGELIMTNETPYPPADDETVVEPAAAAASAGPADEPPAAGRRWMNWRHLSHRRTPLLVAGAAVLLGCLLGAGVTAIATFAGDGPGGDDRGHSSRDGRTDGRGNPDTENRSGDGRGRGGHDEDTDDPATPAPSASAPAASAPAPAPS